MPITVGLYKKLPCSRELNMTTLTETEQRNIQTLSRWYNEMWGQANPDLIPELVNTHYLRHDMTGANNLLTPEEYQLITKMGSEGREVEDFTYYLVAEGDYVGALGRYIRDGNDQWDWVQIFRLEDGLLSETWLPAMGGNEPRAFAAGNNVWQGIEIPAAYPNPNTPNKVAVREMFEALAGGQNIAGYFVDTVRWHDMLDSDVSLSASDVNGRVNGWMNGDTADNMQLFLIEQNDIVFCGLRWTLGEDQRSWDWVCAFRLENNKIAQAWLDGINGSVVPVQQSIDVLWGEGVLPVDSHRLGTKV